MRFKINSDEFANEVIKYVGRYNLIFFLDNSFCYILIILEKNFILRLKFFILFIIIYNSS